MPPEIGFLKLMIWVTGSTDAYIKQALKGGIVVLRHLLIRKDFEQGVMGWLMAQSLTVCTDTLLVLLSMLDDCLEQ